MDLAEVTRFLQRREGDVADVTLLEGGYWSTAFAYRTPAGDERVVRFSSLREGFEADAAAMAYASADLPVPDVLEIGTREDGTHYAISVRHHGRFLEDVEPGDADRAGPTIVRLLAALRATPVAPAPAPAWHHWLRATLEDRPGSVTFGWRATLERAFPDAARLHDTVQARIHDLLPVCPAAGTDLVHGDLLHQNVLVDEGATKVSAVFSWKCAEVGDHLYDVAWFTFWAPWHPGIAAVDLWRRLGRPDPVRHHCYELHIGARHLGWHAYTGDAAGLEAVARRTADVLGRGPLP